MKHQLTAQLGQGIHLTPQLLHSIRLLQLTAPQLELEIRTALERNPLLELEDDEDAGATDCIDITAGPETAAVEVAAVDEFREPAFAEMRSQAGLDGLEDATARLRAAESSDPRVRVMQSLPTAWDEQALGIAAWWLDRVDDRGYLEGDLASLLQEGSVVLGVSTTLMAEIRHGLLHGEFPGMAAVDLAECLRAQLQAMRPCARRSLACTILDQHADLLQCGRLDAIAILTGSTAAEIADAVDLLRTLQPAAVEELPPRDADYTIPDVVAWQSGGLWHVALNNASVPQVRVNAFAEQALASAGAAASGLRSMLDDARWLVRGLAMRNDTLLRTVQVLVRRQVGFLENGAEAIVPLTLADVASEIGMHESTVSRVTMGKVIQTPRGLIEMKRLFASRLDGAEVSGIAVRAMVKRLIDSEPTHAPLADATIATLLARKGIRVARRTVAKYRDQLAIGSARARGTRDLQMTGTC